MNESILCSGLSALKALADKMERENPQPVDMRPRFANGRYRDCRWCGGKGCVSCKIECDKEYARQFPNGPGPLLVLTTPEEIVAARSVIGVEAIEKAFGPNGGGMQEIVSNIEAFKKAQGKS